MIVVCDFFNFILKLFFDFLLLLNDGKCRYVFQYKNKNLVLICIFENVIWKYVFRGYEKWIFYFILKFIGVVLQLVLKVDNIFKMVV